MTHSTHVFKWSETAVRMMKVHGYTPKCYRCSVAFRLGEWIRRVRGSHKSKFFHQQCWEAMLF